MLVRDALSGQVRPLKPIAPAWAPVMLQKMPATLPSRTLPGIAASKNMDHVTPESTNEKVVRYRCAVSRKENQAVSQPTGGGDGVAGKADSAVPVR